MHQTTCGETHKIEIFQKSSVLDFLEDQKESFENYQDTKTCIYSNKRVINSPSINYLNEFFSRDINNPNNQLKFVLKKEFDDCERIYPFAGEIFLNLFFDKSVLKTKKLEIFTKQFANKFLETSKEDNAKNIARWVLDNSSSDRTISIKDSYIENIVLKKEDDIFFNIEYDCSFLGNKETLDMKEYRFAIIDGYIESVSEIHHMLHFAAESKEPYVIFCFGMSEEVKNVIIQNNSRGITQVFPFSMNINEDTINILNDIAMLHNSDVISYLKGQTISQEMRKKLKKGRFISFNRKGFKIEPLCDRKAILKHIDFLRDRIDKSPPDANTDLIKDRIKNLHTKVLNIYVPKELKVNTSFNRELDYLLRMLKTSEKCYLKASFDNRELYIPNVVFEYITKKVNKTKELFYSIDKVLIHTE